MPRTIESIVNSHRLASERRDAGRPIWDRKVRIKHLLVRSETDEQAAEVANRVAEALRAKLPQKWFDITSEDYDPTIDEIVDSLASLAPDSYEDDETYSVTEDVDNILDGLYDWADNKRVWIG